MKKTFLSIALALMAITIVKADEGMWLLKELNRQSVERMKELGFTFPIDRLYDESNSSLKDAVVIFGGGCTGVAVSDQGLIFTNHHCGYAAIQKLSAVEHDYLKNGFKADNHGEELHADGLTIQFLRSMEDVSDAILSQIPAGLSEIQRSNAIDSISDAMIDKYEDDPFTSARIIPFYSGNKYYKVVYDVFRDIRLVVTPPSSVGKYGGDTDNWMWPRHTGDFSVFRVYADKDNKPARFSENNVPYQPKYVVPVSMAGVNDGDYAMTIGYPGSTQRYLSSFGIKQMMESQNKPRIEVRGVKQDIWWNEMTQNDTIRLKYANKYAGSSNYWKNSMGMNEALVKLGVLGEKEELESRLSQWIDSSEQNSAKYGDLLSSLKEAYEGSAEDAKYVTYFMETFNNGIELIRFANTILQFNPGGTDEEKADFINDRILEAYKNYEPRLDHDVVVSLMELYAKRVPEKYHPDIYNVINEEFGGDYKAYADWLFANSKFTNLEDLLELLKTADTEILTQDPAMQLAISTKDMGYEISGNMLSSYESIMKGERELIAALIEMDNKKDFYPDATFTQRMSYGSVKGYVPYDGAWYNYYTTEKGIMEKYKEGDPEFDLQQYIRDAIKSRDFGQYAAEDGTLRINFLSDNDITGGNSGSPVMNANAELIGLAFDGNWEALSGDIIFDPDMQRTISVDIRYVLYTIDKIMNAPHIIDELKLVK